MLGFGLLVFAALLGSCASVVSEDEQTTQPRADADGLLQIDNLTRAYDLYIPSSYTKETPVPLVLAFHGSGGNGRGMEQLTGLNRLAEQENFIVVYPDGINAHWHTGRRAQPDVHDDIGFVSALIDRIDQQYNLDRSRVYATGFSNGGMFAHRVSCELSDKVAASAAVAATMPENLSRTCQPTRPISMLLIHGTDDPAVPYGEPGKALLSLADTVKYWSNHNRCASETVTERLPNTSHVRLDAYQQCSNETTVELYTIEGGNHTWPSIPMGTETEEPTPDQEISASEIVWNFFSQNEVSGTNSASESKIETNQAKRSNSEQAL